MIVLNVHYTFALEDADKAASIFRELQELSRKEPGVITFDIARGTETPNVFALWEEYDDEAAIDAHKETEHFKRLVLNGIRTMAKGRIALQGPPI
jgi:quinol monooxygenase YgiN